MWIIFHQLEALTGVPEDQIRIMLAFFLSVPFGLFVKSSMKAPSQRQTSGMIFGLIVTYFIYQEAILNVLLQAIIVYAMVKILGKKAALPVFIETILYVSIHHIYRQYYDYGGWKMDVTGILMVNTQKWTSFAFCCVDGKKAKVDPNKLSKDQIKRKIDEIPSFYDYFCYIFYYAGAIIGPFYDYYDYSNYIHSKEQFVDIPSTGKETFRLFKNAAFFAIISQVGTQYFPVEFVITEEFGNYNYAYKLIWMNVMVMICRCKYYSGWLFSEMSIASSGMTLKEVKDGIPIWLNITAIDPKVELVYNIKDILRMWNISTQIWLEKYVYSRIYSEEEIKKSAAKQRFEIIQQFRQQRAFLITYFVSALWHGFYPGYFITFFFWGILSHYTKLFYKAGQNTPYFKIFSSNILMKSIRFFFAKTLFNIYGVSFVLLSFSNVHNFFANLYYIPNIINVAIFIFFITTGFGQRAPKKQTDIKKD